MSKYCDNCQDSMGEESYIVYPQNYWLCEDCFEANEDQYKCFEKFPKQEEGKV